MKKASLIFALICFAALIVGVGSELRRFPVVAVVAGLGPCVLTLAGLVMARLR